MVISVVLVLVHPLTRTQAPCRRKSGACRIKWTTFNANSPTFGARLLSRVAAMLQGSNASNAVETLAAGVPPEVGRQIGMSFSMIMIRVTTRWLVVAAGIRYTLWYLSFLPRRRLRRGSSSWRRVLDIPCGTCPFSLVDVFDEAPFLLLAVRLEPIRSKLPKTQPLHAYRAGLTQPMWQLVMRGRCVCDLCAAHCPRAADIGGASGKVCCAS